MSPKPLSLGLKQLQRLKSWFGHLGRAGLSHSDEWHGYQNGARLAILALRLPGAEEPEDL